MAKTNPIADAYYLAAKRWLDANYRPELLADDAAWRRRRRPPPVAGGGAGNPGSGAGAGGTASGVSNAAASVVAATLSMAGAGIAGSMSGFFQSGSSISAPYPVGASWTDNFGSPQLQSWWMNRRVNASISSGKLLLAGHSSGSYGTLQFGENYAGYSTTQSLTLVSAVLGGVGLFFDGSFNSSGQLTAGYARRISGTNCELGTIVDDVITPGLTPASVFSAGDVMTVIWDGSTIDIQKNGVSQGTLARTANYSPYCGIMVQAGSGTYGPYTITQGLAIP